jgi:hypothetical protein
MHRANIILFTRHNDCQITVARSDVEDTTALSSTPNPMGANANEETDCLKVGSREPQKNLTF